MSLWLNERLRVYRVKMGLSGPREHRWQVSTPQLFSSYDFHFDATLLELLCAGLVLFYSSIAALRLGPSASALGSDASTLNSLVERMQQLESHNQQLQDMLRRQNAKCFDSPSPTKGVEPLSAKTLQEDSKDVTAAMTRPLPTPVRAPAPAALPAPAEVPQCSEPQEPKVKVNSSTHPKDYAKLVSGLNCELWSCDFRIIYIYIYCVCVCACVCVVVRAKNRLYDAGHLAAFPEMASIWESSLQDCLACVC